MVLRVARPHRREQPPVTRSSASSPAVSCATPLSLTCAGSPQVYVQRRFSPLPRQRARDPQPRPLARQAAARRSSASATTLAPTRAAAAASKRSGTRSTRSLAARGRARRRTTPGSPSPPRRAPRTPPARPPPPSMPATTLPPRRLTRAQHSPISRTRSSTWVSIVPTTPSAAIARAIPPRSTSTRRTSAASRDGPPLMNASFETTKSPASLAPSPRNATGARSRNALLVARVAQVDVERLGKVGRPWPIRHVEALIDHQEPVRRGVVAEDAGDVEGACQSAK